MMDTVDVHAAVAATVRIPTVHIVTVGGHSGSREPLPGQGVDNLLMEGSGNILLEDGGIMLLETEVVKQLN